MLKAGILADGVEELVECSPEGDPTRFSVSFSHEEPAEASQVSKEVRTVTSVFFRRARSICSQIRHGQAIFSSPRLTMRMASIKGNASDYSLLWCSCSLANLSPLTICFNPSTTIFSPALSPDFTT